MAWSYASIRIRITSFAATIYPLLSGRLRKHATATRAQFRKLVLAVLNRSESGAIGTNQCHAQPPTRQAPVAHKYFRISTGSLRIPLLFRACVNHRYYRPRQFASTADQSFPRPVSEDL